MFVCIQNNLIFKWRQYKTNSTISHLFVSRKLYKKLDIVSARNCLSLKTNAIRSVTIALMLFSTRSWELQCTPSKRFEFCFHIKHGCIMFDSMRQWTNVSNAWYKTFTHKNPKLSLITVITILQLDNLFFNRGAVINLKIYFFSVISTPYTVKSEYESSRRVSRRCFYNLGWKRKWSHAATNSPIC